MGTPPNPSVHALIQCAKANRLARLWYRKGATRHTMRPRLVEPYCFREGSQDLMVKCYQVEHGDDAAQNGWRFFMIHKIDNVEPTDWPFHPRTKISMPTGEVAESSEPSPGWFSEGRREYRDLIGDAMADGIVTAADIDAINACRRAHNLSDDDIRYVHTAVYHRCLGAVLDDGHLSREELLQIRFLHKVMKAFGWSIGD